jgi:hypothetical protein
MSMIGNGGLILMASAALVLSGYNSLGQSLDDSAARAQLAKEITQKYGVRVGADLSLTQLYAIVVGLGEIYSIARQDHASLGAGGSRSAEFDEMEARMLMANRINQQYGTSLDWRQYDFLELFLLDQKLRGSLKRLENSASSFERTWKLREPREVRHRYRKIKVLPYNHLAHCDSMTLPFSSNTGEPLDPGEMGGDLHIRTILSESRDQSVRDSSL